MDDLLLEESIGALTVGSRTSMLMEVLAYDDEQHNHIMRSALYGQIFALKGVLHKDVAVYLLVGASVESQLPNRLHADEQTMICPRPPISLQNMTKVIEVCSGLGCLGIGLEHAGSEVVLRTDLSAPMVDLAKQIHPSPTMCADITSDITMGKICETIPYSCSLAAGVSCQPYSRLGDKRQKMDPRSRTLPTVLRMSFLMRQAIVIIECVDEASNSAWVQQVLASFHKYTGYKIHQGLLHLQNIWPAKRSRWWCVVSHPMLGDLPWKPYPQVINKPLISHVLDDFMTCTKEDLNQIELDSYELSHFEKAGFLNNEISLHSQMSTSLHSCANQLSGCPCLCRKFPFSNDRLSNGGLHGLLVRMIGETKASYATFPRYRHIHPKELALLNGMNPALPWGNQLRLALAGLGQMASPLQSCWIGSSVLHQLSMSFHSSQSIPTPEENLLKLMGHLLEQRDCIFGKQEGANARVFQAMVSSSVFVMPNLFATPENLPQVGVEESKVDKVAKPPVSREPFAEAPKAEQANEVTLSQGGGNGLSDTEFANAVVKHLPVENKQWMSDAGGVMGFAVQPQKGIGGSPKEKVKIPQVHHEPPKDSFDKAENNHPESIENPQDTDVEIQTFPIVLLSVGVDNPFDVKVAKGTTPSQLALGESKLNPEHQSIAARSMVGTHLPLYEPVVPEQVVRLVDMNHEKVAHCPRGKDCFQPEIRFPCTRLQALFQQQGWVADDEMNFYMEELQSNNLGIHVSVAMPGESQWFEDMAKIEEVGKAKFSAVLDNGHWLPFTMLYEETDIKFFMTPEGQAIGEHLANLISTDTQKIQTFHRVLIDEFAGDCGFQSIIWIQTAIDGSTRKPMTPKEAEFMRRNFTACLFEQSRALTEVSELNLGGMNNELNIQAELIQLLVDHGVFQDRVEERANMLMQKLPTATIQGALKSPKPWADLKAAANQATPSLKLVLADELARQIANRSKDPSAVGKKSMKAKSVTKEKPSFVVQAEDLSIPAGVFKQHDGVIVSHIGPHQVGNTAQGVLLMNQNEAEATLRLARPVSRHGLALIVLIQKATDVQMHPGQMPIRFPVICTRTGEPMIVTGVMHQLGQQEIIRNEPATKLAVDEREAGVIRCLAYKDQIGNVWNQLAQQPVKQVLALEPSVTTDKAGQSIIMDVWDRQFYTKRFEKTKHDSADIFAFSMRVYLSEIDAILALSGSKGIYFEPRSMCGRMPSTEYHVTWIPQAGHQDAKYAQQTSPQATTLVRHGDRYGLRSDAMNAQEIHQKHRPGTPLLLGNQKQLFLLGPLPFSTTKEGICKLISAWQWDARPLQPRGRTMDGAGINWLIQGTENPTHWIYTLKHGDVLITRLPEDKPVQMQDACTIVASKKTSHQLMKKEGEDPIFIDDPWMKGRNSESSRATPSAPAVSHSQIASIEANLEKKLLEKLAKSDEDVSMDSCTVELSQKVQRLENQMSQVVQSQQAVEVKINGMQQQIDQQHSLFAGAVERQMQEQMDKIECLLSKRNRLE